MMKKLVLTDGTAELTRLLLGSDVDPNDYKELLTCSYIDTVLDRIESEELRIMTWYEGNPDRIQHVIIEGDETTVFKTILPDDIDDLTEYALCDYAKFVEESIDKGDYQINIYPIDDNGFAIGYEVDEKGNRLQPIGN